MTVLFGYHEACEDHLTGTGHPESPARLIAALRGVEAADLGDGIVRFAPRRASLEEIARVHDRAYSTALEDLCTAGGGFLDADTVVSSRSFEAALRAAGAGLDAVERLDRGEATAAFLAVRPPGHHALFGRAMGFCLFNNIAVTAATLVGRGERVLILDWDAHHGNGTQQAFYEHADVLFVSMHQYPFYPGTGAVTEIGSGSGLGTTINVPFPSGTAGDAYRRCFDELVSEAAERFAPSWVLVSAGFDAHRADPLTDLGLSSGDFADLTTRSAQLGAPGRRIFFLEGGYDLGALSASVAASVAALAGVSYRPEAPTSGCDSAQRADAAGSPAAVIAAAKALHERTQQC